MVEAIFNYNENEIILYCNINDKLLDICNQFANKISADINELYFLYGGLEIDKNLYCNELMNNIDKKRGKINILVYDKKRAIINNSIVKSKEIICPKCYENCRIKMNNYKIILYGCKNEHIIKNILLEKFNETQMIDESKIICSNCNNNKSNAYNKEFYKCLKCDLNLCPLCKSIHDKDHKIIDYEKRNYFCNIHNESFFSFCEECNLNLCIFCEKKHNNNHKIINYKDILLEENEIKDKLKEFKNRINEYEKSIKEIINIFNNVIDNR